MKPTPVIVLVAAAVLGAAVPAAASRGRAAGTLQLTRATLQGPFAAAGCPAGMPDTNDCWAISNAGIVRGLGAVSESGLLVVTGPHTTCEVWQSTATLTVAGKGTIELSTQTPPGACFDAIASTGADNVTQQFTVTGGTGAYAGASGSGTVAVVGIAQVRQADAFVGMISAPTAVFDLTPPVIHVAPVKSARLPKGKKGTRVHYAVTAHDDVDGSVPATCEPASGSIFRIGRTRVSCTASDSSGNTATAGFTVTVKR